MIYKNLFKLCDTYGFPLECAYDEVVKQGIQVDWYQFCLDAKKAGWKQKTCKNKIKYCLMGDFKTKEYINEVMKRVEVVYENYL